MELAGKTIAVTGATGFLGRYISECLLSRGARVVGVVRRPDRVPALKEAGVEMRRADLADRDALTAGFAGADAVVSNAALFRLTNRDWESHLATNVAGTTNVMEAAATAGVQRVTHVSSVAVYKGRAGGHAVKEDHPKLTREDRGWFNAYWVSKALSEAAAWERAGALGLALTCVRPSAIYGAHDENFTRIVAALGSAPVTVMPFGMTIPVVYARDVAAAIARTLEEPVSVGRSYNVSSPVAARTLLAQWARAAGRRPWVRVPLPVPFRLLIDSQAARDDLGWEPTPLCDGLRRTVEEDS